MIIERKKINLQYIFFVICIYILVFQNLLQNYFSIFRYTDELLSMMIFPIIIAKLIKNRDKVLIKKNFLIMILALVVLIVVGLYSNIKYKYQSKTIVLSDMIVVLKFFLVYFLSYNLWSQNFINDYNKTIKVHTRFITILLFALTILNYIFTIFPAGKRFGIMTNKLFYTHPTILAAICIFLLAINVVISEKVINKYSIMTIIILLSTLRIKAIVIAIVAIIISLYVKKTDKKISLSKLGILGVIIIIIAYDQIAFYFIDNTASARERLLTTSFKIASDYFPIGTGFGTYGSFYSGVSYSPIYAKYRINNIYGLQDGKSSFISDSFWPMILGQFGVIGFICYVICIWMIFKRLQSEYSIDNKNIYIRKDDMLYISSYIKYV